MTDAVAAAGTEVEPVLTGALALLTDNPEATLDALSALVVTVPESRVTAEAQPFPALPKHVPLTEELRRALNHLPEVFNSVEPKARRSLSQTEIDLLTIEQGILGLIGSAMAARMEAVKETIRHHMDVDAEEKGIAAPKAKVDSSTGAVIVPATPRDQSGHYLLAEEKHPHQVQAGPLSWSQERSAAAPKPSGAVLQQAYDAGEIDREDYLAVTMQTRVFDQLGARALIRKDPARGLRVLRRITVAGKPKSSLYLRKNT